MPPRVREGRVVAEPGSAAPPEIRDPEGDLRPEFVAAVSGALAARDAPRLRGLTADLHEADLGAVLEALDPDERSPFVTLLGEDFDFTALTEVEESVRVQILDELPTEVVAEGMREIDSDDAVYILEDLEAADQAEILAEMPAPERIALQRALDYPEESAGRRMQTEFIAVAPFWTVGQTIDYLREHQDLPEEFYEIFVVDPGFRLLGTVSLNRILRSRRGAKISEVMEDSRHRVSATEDQEAVARLFQRYNLVQAAVVDEGERLVGVITVDDVLDVIHEEAEEDIRALAGLGDGELSDSVVRAARSRIPWLFINLGTAFISASVIGLFDASIEKMVALAVLMPIVASMGGNAGTQAMTVTVRALATRELGIGRRALRVVIRETLVGLLNGIALSIALGLVAGLWFGTAKLGLVIAAALVINLFVAGVFGTVIPITLARLKADPAVASSVFLTTMTDSIGFFVFLGLASLAFGL